jgi:hypothetical protein
MPRFFAVTASVAESSSAARLRAVRGPTMAFLRNVPPSLAADPLRPSTGGAEPDAATSDAPCRSVDACVEVPSPRSRAVPVFCQAGRRFHFARPPRDNRPLRLQPRMRPERLPLARFSTLRPSECSRFPGEGTRRGALCTRSPDTIDLPRPGLTPCRATTAPPLPPRGDLGGTRKMPLANFCNRRSTRAPVSSPDCRARSLP